MMRPVPVRRSVEAVNVIRLLDLRDEPLSVDEAMAAVAAPGAGGAALFVGTVRNEDRGRTVTSLSYSAHPSALARLRDVADEVAASYPVHGLVALHRVGDLAVGDLAVVVAVSCPHRAQAFEAARRLIDDLKHGVPIWKRQAFPGGRGEWVGADESDEAIEIG